MRLLPYTICIFCIFHQIGTPVYGQAPNLQLTLRYNLALTRYEVYALPSATQNVFNWGPSQISIVAPASVSNAAFSLTSVAGGAWQDNSQIYAPSVDPAHDFHGVGSLGAITPLVQGVEKLIFHLTLPGGGCVPGLRLFINGADPDSGAPGMSGGDFSNTVFAIVPGVPAGYESFTANYANGGTSCSLPLDLTRFLAIAGVNAIDLSWQAENEVDFDRFELERATKEWAVSGFSTIGYRAGTSTYRYTYRDDSAKPDVVYFYRLKMVDYDGSFTYSHLIQAAIEKKGCQSVRVSPNPASDWVIVKFLSLGGNGTTATLRDVTGRVLATQTLLSQNEEMEMNIDLKPYASGIYLLTLSGDTNQLTTRIICSK